MNATPRPNASRLLGTSQRLTRVFQALHDHPEQPHTLDELARLACLSPSRFHAMFGQSMGMPPLKYLQHLRMDQARMLLLTTDLAVREISERIGLENPFYFSRLFRKTTGASPQQYRQQTRRGAWRTGGGK